MITIEDARKMYRPSYKQECKFCSVGCEECRQWIPMGVKVVTACGVTVSWNRRFKTFRVRYPANDGDFSGLTLARFRAEFGRGFTDAVLDSMREVGDKKLNALLG